MQKELIKLFENFLTNDSIFINKKVLQSNYTPNEILYREEQINQIAKILAPSLKLDKPSNLFIYGKTGTGKTLTIKFVTNQIKEIASQREVPLNIFYINCKLKRVADTEYRLLVQLLANFNKKIPPTGLPTDEVYKIFFETIDNKKQLLILILDEIDYLVKKNKDILYNLTRINSELKNSQISIIGVSNDLVFTDSLDPRIKSSLSEEELIFPPYNAIQLKHILKDRVKKALNKDVIEEGVIEKCAAYAARDHGDARRAIELLRVAAELAERDEKKKVKIAHLDLAEQKIERSMILDIVKVQPKQFQLCLYSILELSDKRKERICTGEVYELYRQLCISTDLRPLTQRRISDMISELDLLGIINVRVISKGRYGKTREISSLLSTFLENKIKILLRENLF